MGLFTLQNEFYLIFVFALESTPLVNKEKSGYDIGAELNMLPLPTLIQFAKFSAKILLMAKLLQNY